MIPFKPVALEDRDTVEKYTLQSSFCNCDLAFTNIFCWHSIYRSDIAVEQGRLLLRFLTDGTPRRAYMQPLGIDAADFSPLLPALAADAAVAGEPLRLVLSEEALQYLPEGEYAVDENRDFEDYVYSADDLRTLQGSHYKPKRNHINRFTAEYQYRFEELQPRHVEQCLAVEAEWRSRHPDSASLEIEAEVMRRAFANFKALGLRGGVLYVGERMVAFTYGSMVTADTFCTHIEKADTDYDGAFAMINRLFAQSLPAEFHFINREEDLGIEGLRRSKLSYHPCRMCRKYSAVRLDERMRGIRHLWREVFGDTEEFINSFLARFYSPQLSITQSDAEGNIISMAHIVPVATEYGRTAYVYAVATEPTQRGRGLATEVMQRALERARKGWGGKFDAVALIPADERLKAFYARFGFEDVQLPLSFGALNTSSEGMDNFAGTTSTFELGTGNRAMDLAMVLRIK